ncbi:LacI family DNA-binding transcriptional regulator [Halomonas sp. LS-001]
MTAHRRMTLKDLAAELGVSTATISNAFNRPDQLSPLLRDRILREAKRMGYNGPDAKARSLRTGRSGIVAVILAESLTYSLNDAVASEFLAGVAEVLDAHGHTMLLLPGRGHASRPPGSANIADGFIVYGLMPDNRLLDELPSQRLLVSVDFDIEDSPTVHIDDQEASYHIAQHALKTRPKRPAVINLRLTKEHCNGRVTREHTMLPNSSTISRARLAGFHAALSEAGYDIEQIPLWNIEENVFDVCSPVVTEILDAPDDQRPDLLLCMSDRIALTALTLAEQQNIKVPEELRITGFDGIAEGQYRSPRLTTVRQDSAEKGRVAAQIVLGRLAKKAKLLKTQLIVGETCP